MAYGQGKEDDSWHGSIQNCSNNQQYMFVKIGLIVFTATAVRNDTSSGSMRNTIIEGFGALSLLRAKPSLPIASIMFPGLPWPIAFVRNRLIPSSEANSVFAPGLCRSTRHLWLCQRGTLAPCRHIPPQLPGCGEFRFRDSGLRISGASFGFYSALSALSMPSRSRSSHLALLLSVSLSLSLFLLSL